MTNITKDEFYMGTAILASLRSKDPKTKVGCCIVDSAGIILSTGYNGFPFGIKDSKFNWTKIPDKYGAIKHDYVVHAELNAILNAGGKSLKNAILYTTLFPCKECAKAIIQAGIKKVIYLDIKDNSERFKSDFSHMLFDTVGITVKPFNSLSNIQKLDLNFYS